jgi:hypothetical protein
MGRRNIFTSVPTKPKVAKLAWAKAGKHFGQDPERLTYDSTERTWIAIVNGERLQMEEDKLRGLP